MAAIFGRGRGRGAPAMNSDDRPSQDSNGGESQGFRSNRGGGSNFGGDRQSNDDGPTQRGGFAPRGRGGFNRGEDQGDNFREQPARDRGEDSNSGRGRGGFNNQSQNGYSDSNSQDQGFSGRGRGRGAPQNFGDDRRNDNGNDFNAPPQRGSMRGGRGGYEQPRDNGYSSRGGRDNYDQPRDNGYSSRGNRDGGFNDRQSNDYGNSRDSEFASTRGRGGGRGGQQSYGGDRQGNDDGFQSGPPQRGGYSQRGSRGGYDNPSDGFNGPSRSRGNFQGGDRRGDNDFDGFSGRGRGRGDFSNGGGRGDFSNGGGDRPRGCFNCGQEGHMSRDCTEERQPRQGGGSCYNCGGEGHMSRDCPNPRQERGQDRGGFAPRGRGEFGNARGGGVSSASYYDADEDRPIRRSFIPKTREVDDIFKEDEARANMADNLYEQDGGVQVENGPENLAIFEDWGSAGFSPQILDNIQRSKFAKPRNFQKYALPLVMEGFDIKGQAETGSGKSAAFLLPIIHVLSTSFNEPESVGVSRRSKVYALIIEPTRELAKQLWEQASKFAHNTGVTVNFAYGEYNMGVNKQSLFTKGSDILIGTPGRLKHLLGENVVSAESLQFLVLDEADRLLDQSFMADIIEMTKIPGFPSTDERQTLFFSATFDRTIQQLANELCKQNSVVIKNLNSNVNNRIKQEIIYVPINDRKTHLLQFLKQETDANGGVLPKKLVFVETKRDADFVATLLCDNGIVAQTVNGDRPQDLREAATAGFRNGEFLVLVVTNVFARGMDFTDLGHVINMFLPTDRDTYVHRIGRTGRLNSGKATSFFDPDHPNDRDMAETIIKELENAGEEVPEFLRGGSNPFASYARNNASSNSRNGGGGYSNNDEPAELEAPDF